MSRCRYAGFVSVACVFALGVPSVAVGEGASSAVVNTSSTAIADTGDVRNVGRNKFIRHVAGKVQISKGLRVKGAPVHVETLTGKRLSMPRKTRTSIGGGIFFPVKGLPRRFVVVVDGTDRSKNKGRGNLRAFVDRRDRSIVPVSFGTTVAVKTYRLAKGKWSISKAQRRTVKALGLPAYTTLGFDDRVNPVYVSRKILLEKSNGDLDKFTKKVAKRARAGSKPVILFRGKGPKGVRRNVGTLLHPRDGKRKAAGVLGDLGNVFMYGSALAGDISAGSTAVQLNKILNDMTALNSEMDDLNTQVSQLQTALSNGFAQMAQQLAQDNYNQEAASWNDANYGIADVFGYFEAIQTTPCPNWENCSVANANNGSYQGTLDTFGPEPVANQSWEAPSAPSLILDANAMLDAVFDGVTGNQGLITSAWEMVSSQTATGGNPLTTNTDFSPALPVPFTGLTQPVSDEALSAVNYWYGQLEQVMIFGVNYQNGPTPQASLDSGGLNDLVYNLKQSYKRIPDEVPDGLVYDPSFDALWGQFGQVWLNQTPLTAASTPPAGITFNGLGVTFGSGYQALTGSSVGADTDPQDYSWQIPQVDDVSSQTTGVATQWSNSAQLLWPNPTQGLLTLFPGTTSTNVWEYVAALPVSDNSGGSDTFAPFLVGLWGANSAIPTWGVPIWVAWSPQGDIPPSSWAYNVLQGSMVGAQLSSYQVPTFPTGTPNLLLYSYVPNGTSYTWDGYIPTDSPPAMAPQAPLNVTAVNGTSAGAVTVSWDTPYSGSTPIVSYTATASPGGQTCTATSPAISCVVSGLTPGGSYLFTVTATNATLTGPGAQSNSVVAPGLPGPVQNLKAVYGPGGEEATVSWSPPANAAQFPVTGYTVNFSYPLSQACTVTLPATSCTVTGLIDGLTYRFAVNATNAYGSGPLTYSGNVAIP